eukprot:XP_020399124.1 proline-rich protein HaeIII subfamily 1-like [Zea mays]
MAPPSPAMAPPPWLGRPRPDLGPAWPRPRPARRPPAAPPGPRPDSGRPIQAAPPRARPASAMAPPPRLRPTPPQNLNAILDPFLGAMGYGAEFTHLGAIDLGAELPVALSSTS